MSDNTNFDQGEGNSPLGQGAGDSATTSGGRGRKRGVVIAGAAAGLLVVGGVAALAGSQMLGGGGTQPESVLPGDAIFFSKVDLDPGVAQKVGAFRLMDKVPQAKSALQSGDPKKAFVEWAKTTDPDLSDIDYATDIEPWLGDRAGIALLEPQGSATEPVVVMALAVKDEAKAREGIATLEAKTKDAVGKAKSAAGSMTSPSATSGTAAAATPTKAPGAGDESVQIYKDGYLLVTSKKDEQRVRAALEQPSLAQNATFTGDMSALGETGVASGWVDGSKALKLNGGTSMPAAMEEIAGLSGRSAFALRFASDYLELAQVNRGMTLKTQAAPLKDVTNLPADTGAFYSFSGGSDYVGELWPLIKKFAAASGAGDIDAQLKEVEQQTGLVLPADVQTLLGKQFDVVVGQQDFTKLAGMPKVGVRMWTDTAKAQSILDKVTKLAAAQTGSPIPLVTKTVGEHLDVGLDDSYTSSLAGGDLSSAPGLKTVLPELGSSVSALYVNLDAYESQYLESVPADQRELVKALQSVGMTAQAIKDGEQHSTLRVSVN